MTWVKIAITVPVLLAINAVARRNAQLGGLLAALPIVSFVSVAFLKMDGFENGAIAQFMTGVLFGLLPTAVLLGTTVLALHRGAPFVIAAPLGAAAWLAFAWLARFTKIFGP